MKVEKYINLVDSMKFADIDLKERLIRALPSQDIMKRGFAVVVQTNGGMNYLVKRRPQLFSEPIESRDFVELQKCSRTEYRDLEPGNYFIKLWR